jgi:hypothetical protein
MNKEFKPISETNVIPQNGRVLIKVTNKNFPVIGIINDKIPSGLDIDIELKIVGTARENFNIGDEVILSLNGMADDNNKIMDRDNERSMVKIKEHLDSLSHGERLELTTKGTTYEIIEYLLVPDYEILATIKK